MNKKPRRMIVDMHDERVPAVGDIVRHHNTRGSVLGFLRVVGVRQVKVKVSRGEVARFALALERLDGFPSPPPRGQILRFLNVHDNPPRPKPDRFSPLL